VVGVGVLGLPEALASLGWMPGLLTLVLCGMASVWSGRMYTQLVLAVPEAHVLADVVHAAYGNTGRVATMVLGYSYIAGVGVVYHLTASQAIQQVLAGLPYFQCQPVAGLIFGFMMILPLQAQSMHAVSCLSFVGASTIIGAIIIVGIKLVAAGPMEDAQTVVMEQFSLKRWAAGITCCIFAFAGQAIFVELISRQRVYASFKRTVSISSTIALVLYVACSSLGYAYVGRDIRGPLTSVLKIDVWTRVTNMFLFIHVGIGYVIEMNVLTDAALRLVWPSAWQLSGSEPADGSLTDEHLESKMLLAGRIPWFIVSSVLVMGCYILESSIPFFSQLVSLTGALQATQIMLSLPALCALRVLPQDKLSCCMRWQCYIAVPSALLLSALGSYGAINDIIDFLSDANRPPPWACAAPLR